MSKISELYKQSSSYYISIYCKDTDGLPVSKEVGFKKSEKEVLDEVLAFAIRYKANDVTILLGENFSDGWPHEVKVNVQIKYELTEL